MDRDHWVLKAIQNVLGGFEIAMEAAYTKFIAALIFGILCGMVANGINIKRTIDAEEERRQHYTV